MDLGNLIGSVIVIIITTAIVIFPVRIYLNLRECKEAALGLIFTNLIPSITAFKIFTLGFLIFALTRLIDILNAFNTTSYDLINNITTLLYLVVTIVLTYAFYRLSVITKIKEKEIER